MGCREILVIEVNEHHLMLKFWLDPIEFFLDIAFCMTVYMWSCIALFSPYLAWQLSMPPPPCRWNIYCTAINGFHLIFWGLCCGTFLAALTFVWRFITLKELQKILTFATYVKEFWELKPMRDTIKIPWNCKSISKEIVHIISCEPINERLTSKSFMNPVCNQPW